MRIYDYQDICEILRSEIALKSGVESQTIDLQKPLQEYALDSVKVVRLASILEENLRIDVEPTFMYEYPSIENMAKQFTILHQKKAHDQNKTEIGIHITASFTAEPIEEVLAYWLQSFSYKPHFTFSGYNQTFQELINHDSDLFKQDSHNIMLLRIEDWFRFRDTATCNEVIIAVEDFIVALENAAQQQNFKLILGICAHSPSHVRKLGISEILDDLDQQILDISQKHNNIQTVDLRKLNNDYSVDRIYDEARDQLGHIPFTQVYFATMATELAKRIFLSRQQPYKVIVLDCDNTLWQGVCGEDGYNAVKISEPFRQLQQWMIQQMQSGKILCLASKNREQDVWEVFEKNSDMVLQKKHIVTQRINWQPKPQNIKDMADELQLGLESFIFIDDNPAECAAVRSALPQVSVLHLPQQPLHIANTLKHFWPLHFSGVPTTEDKKRTQMYVENKKRKQLQNSVVDFADFLQKLQVVIRVELLAGEDITRAAQLTQRTNQFNATTIRRSQMQIKNLMADTKTFLFSVHVKDKFGDYGFVGLMICYIKDKHFVCETFLMSCRVLGRKVETTMVKKIACFAQKHGCTHLCLDFISSERNEPLFNFYASLSPSLRAEKKELQQIVLEIANIDTILDKAHLQNNAPAKKTSSPTKTPTQNHGDVLQKIADLQGNIQKMTVTSLTKIKRPAIATAFVTPRTSWQKKLAVIWCDVLRMDRVGIYDNFYELGGDSLRAAEVFARMWDLGVCESISLQTIPDPTIAGLEKAIDDVKNGRKPSLLMDIFSLEDEAQVAKDIRIPPSDYKHLTMNNVFVTGATGYIGAFLIAELFAQTSVNVLCMVRAATKNDGFERVRRNLQQYNLWKDAFSTRIDIVLGDLTEPLFGLSPQQFREVAARIDTIFHSGAWVNFVYPYQYLQKSNVYSVETVLRLAVSDKPRPIQVHFVSTLGVIMSTGYARGEVVYETQELEHSEDLLNGYEQSKFVGDKMVWLAMKERNIPANMYRPGMVSGLSSDGTYHKLDEFLPCFLKACIQIGSWPLVDTTWEMVPIDYVSKAIVHIAKNPQNLNKAYFSLHPNSLQVQEFIKWHQDFGFRIRSLPWDVWKKELLNQKGDKLRANALFPFVDFIRALSEKQVYFPPTDKTQFLSSIADSGIECPDQLTLLERYTNYFIKTGYYEISPGM